MAKTNNLVTKGLQGTLQNLTFVNSKAYGDHVRNRRGTFKPAVLNETMEQSKDRLLQVNETASLIFKSICEHKDGTLWPRLLSKLRRQLKETNHNDVLCLLNLECDASHTLDKMLRSHCNVEVEIVKQQMNIAFTLPEPPVYDKRYLKEFQASMHVIFPDLERQKLKKVIAYSDILHKTSCPKEFSFVIPVPAKSTTFAVFLKVTECKNGLALNYPQSTGMRCVAVGLIPGKKEKPVRKKATPQKKKAVKKAGKARAAKKNPKATGS
jgi:hypothetical protein